MMQGQAAITFFAPTQRQPTIGQGQIMSGIELPGRWRMVGEIRWQRLPLLLCSVPPRLPVTTAVRQAQQLAAVIEYRLLQRFITAHALDVAWQSLAVQLRPAQRALGPGQLGALPFDPGQALAIGADTGAVIEIRTLGKQLPGALHVDRNQSMDHLCAAMLFFDGNDTLAQRIKDQPTVAVIGREGQLGAGPAIEQLTIKLLIRLVDEHQAPTSKAQCPATI